MRNLNKYVVGLAALVIVIAVGIYLNRKPASPPPQMANPGSIPTHTTHRPSVHVQRPAQAVEATEPLDKSSVPRVPREKVEEYLRLHNRNTTGLLAAFHALQDTNYLREAATNFPNDPRVQWTVLARNAYPEERRKWLDAFKASSPSNSLANYLSAQDYFENHQPEAALKELADASGKLQFGDYSMETILDGEDLAKFNSSSSFEARTTALAGMSEDLYPELANFKGLALGIREQQQQYLSSGDIASVQALAQTGIAFANRLSIGDSGKLVINRLVGTAAEAIAMQSLDQNTSYDFLGGKTPAERLAELRQQRASIRELNDTFNSALPTMNQDQMANYWERLKIYGEVPAMQWLVQQTATPNTGN